MPKYNVEMQCVTLDIKEVVVDAENDKEALRIAVEKFEELTEEEDEQWGTDHYWKPIGTKLIKK